MPFGNPAATTLSVTLVQLRPVSRETWTLPSSVPAYSRPGRLIDSPTEMIVGHATMPSFLAMVMSLPFTPIVTTSSRLALPVRSAPTLSQVRPRFADRNSLLLAA